MFDKKQHIKSINKSCHIFLENEPLLRKQCKKINKDCDLNICKTETENYANSEITDNEREECKKLNKIDSNKELNTVPAHDCYKRLELRKNTKNLQTQLRHCKANKCIDLTAHNNKIQELLEKEHKLNITKKINKQNKENSRTQELRDKYSCVNKNCKNEYNEYIQDKVPNIMPLIFDDTCNKKYSKYNQYTKCQEKQFKIRSKKRHLIRSKLTTKYNKCLNKKCSKFSADDKLD